MIKKEHLKQAIENIYRQNAEIGYVLDQMLSVGHIDSVVSQDTPPRDQNSLQDNRFYFMFEREQIPVSKYIFINEGTAILEQALLVQYGQRLEKRRIQEKETPKQDYLGHARQVRKAGVRLMINYEIDYALNWIHKHQGHRTHDLLGTLQTVKSELDKKDSIEISSHPSFLFTGITGIESKSYFLKFPFCLNALMQVAELGLEFFHVRFVIECLLNGTLQHLYACIHCNKILGLVYLIYKTKFLFQNVEIKYLASINSLSGLKPELRQNASHCGTFLVAGVFLLWRQGDIQAKEIVLDSEIEARGFYEKIGFAKRGFAEYALDIPQGHLLISILFMLAHREDTDQKTISLLKRSLRPMLKQFKHPAISTKDHDLRKRFLLALKYCLSSEKQPDLKQMILKGLFKFRVFDRDLQELYASATGTNSIADK